MLKIGDFSMLSKISVRMLRHYDERGVLRPTKIDSWTGYRYYDEAQLPLALKIASYRDMGFGVSEIGRMLRASGDLPRLLKFFERRESELQSEKCGAERKLALLRSARKNLQSEEKTSYEVSIKTFPARYAACVRMVLPRYEDEWRAWEILCRETDGLSLVPAEPCLCSVVFLDGEYKERDAEIEAQKTVEGRYDDTEHVKFKTLPAVTVARAIHKGGYEKIGGAYSAVASWVEKAGCEFAAPMFNIYIASPHETQNTDEFVTEVCYPVRRKLRGGENLADLKRKLLCEINSLKIDGIDEVSELFELEGAFVNQELPLPNGDGAKFLRDGAKYLGCQIEKSDGRCVGIACDEDYLLVCEYGEGGAGAKILTLKKRG